MRSIECVYAALRMVPTAIEPSKDLVATLVKPYKINDRVMDQALELKHGKSVRPFMMDKVSNGPFLPVGPVFPGL